MLRAWRTLTEIVGTITIVGIVLIVGAMIFDSVTKKPICNTNFEDEDPDSCPYFIDPDFE